MQYVKNGEGATRAVIDRFGGLDRLGPLCREGAFELRNLRLLSDGSLQRREGVRPLLHLSDAIRGATCIQRGGARESYLVAGKTVYYLTQEEGAYTPHAIGQIGTSEGSVEFYYHGGILVLMDGEELWSVTPTGVERTEAYIPLYGKDWSYEAAKKREIYETPNLLSRRLRIQYRLAEESNTVSTQPLYPVSCDRLFIDGEELTNISYSQSDGLISLGRHRAAGTVVEIFVTMPASFISQRKTICRARRMTSVGDPMSERVMLYDAPDEAQVWISRATRWEDRLRIRQVLPGCCMIYLTENDRYSIGKGNVEVTGACHHYDRSLIFTAGETWMADGGEYENGTLRMITVNSTQGCTSRDGIATLGNTPLCVCDNRILAWNSRTDERDECNAASISLPIESLLDERFATKGALYADPVHNEVWCYLPGEASRILIWQEDSKSWTSFDGLVVDRVFCLEGRVGFYHGNTLYCLDEQADVDTDANGETRPIEIEYLGSYLDFGEPAAAKHVSSAEAFAQCEAGKMTLLLQRADGKKTAVCMQGQGGQLSLLHRRVNVGRFRFLRVGFRTSCKGAVRVFGLHVTARH